MSSHELIKKAYLKAKTAHEERVHKALQLEKQEQQDERKPWPLYAALFREYIRSLSRVFPSVKRWADILSQTSERTDKRALIMDIAGESHPGALDADAITSSLAEHYADTKDERVIRIIGDIADRKVQDQILQAVVAHGGKLKFIVCAPGGGFFGSEGNIYFEHRMGRFLRSLYMLLDRNGEIVIDLLISRREGREEQQQQIQRLESYLKEHAISFERQDTEHIRKPSETRRGGKTEIRSQHTYFRLYKNRK